MTMTMRERERERDCRCDYAAKETNLRAIDDRIRPSVKWQSVKKKGPNQKESKTSERKKGEGKESEKTTQYQTHQEQGGRGGKQVQRRHEIVHNKNETRKTKVKSRIDVDILRRWFKVLSFQKKKGNKV